MVSACAFHLCDEGADDTVVGAHVSFTSVTEVLVTQWLVHVSFTSVTEVLVIQWLVHVSLTSVTEVLVTQWLVPSHHHKLISKDNTCHYHKLVGLVSPLLVRYKFDKYSYNNRCSHRHYIFY